LEQVHRVIDLVAETNLPPGAPAFDAIETKFFELAPVAAVCSEQLPDLLNAAGRMRQLIKWQSEQWPRVRLKHASALPFALRQACCGGRVLLRIRATNTLDLAAVPVITDARYQCSA
jgi:hypothetical protein